MSPEAPSTSVAQTGAALVEEMLVLASRFVREGWCQGDPAQDACGRPVSPASAFASRWSAAGALERAWARQEDRFGVALEAFQRANLAFTTAAGDVPQAWNDAIGRTLPQVLDVLDKAVQLAADPLDADYIAPKASSLSG